MNFIKYLTLAGVVLFLTGCPADKYFGKLRVMHASPDAPEVNVLLNGKKKITKLDYAVSSGFRSVLKGSYRVDVQAIIPGGNANVLSLNPLEVSSGSRTTVLAIGTVAVESGSDIPLELLPVAESASSPAGSEVAVVVVHASPAASALGNVDIFVTGSGAPLAGALPINLGYRGIADAGALPADTYQVRVTPEGDPTTVLFDSGPVDLTPFAGQSLIISAIDAADQLLPAAPIKLLVANDETSLNIRDISTKAGARVAHVSPDAAAAAGGPVEVFATIGGGSVELIPAFDYLDVVPAANSYVGVDAGDYVFDVAPNSDSIGDSVFTSGTVTLDSGLDYSVFAVGRVFGGPDFTLVPTLDDNRSIATQASLKAVHGAAAVGTVDVYVTPAGVFSVIDVEAGHAGAPLVPNFEFGQVTGYVPVPEGSYDVRILDQATGMVVINAEGAPLANGDVVTAIAYGPDESDADPALPGLLLLSN